MHVILTHEQADFDAIASLLGAYLLEADAVPVLPRRINRNVRAFLTLYCAELPFVSPTDLDGEVIDHVTLVDTQSLVSLKGMARRLQVQVIDHHTQREGLPEDWLVTVEEVGATTTLLVEALQERGVVLSPVQATLLLLGIYEDTGSLSYVSTTARDARAVAFLLEQGASLRLGIEYINPPLSPAQWMLYDVRLANLETITIHGQVIAISTANVQGNTEELSTLAHKMRDLLDPDALFLLVTTSGGVQMIARSTSDRVNVAAVVSAFGGGGHDRAAAALIKDASLDAVRAELLERLPRFVSPPITVAQIMSRGPQVLAPDTPVTEAAERMQRFGYEGYPVVRDGHVIGLLTRRAVDRALAHGLNLTAADLMEAGEVTVFPDDPIEHLQQVMVDSGWGQVPVVDRETRHVIGIVTRTDLLKTLTPEPRLPGRHNLAEHLERALPPARLALIKAVAAMAHEQHAALYIVGGFVRDLLLDRPSLDFDLVVEGDAIALARALGRRFGGRVTSHARFGTAKWHLDAVRESVAAQLADLLPDVALDPDDLPATLDLVTARTEFYTHPTALPTVARGSIKLDLHRRDFTINTLALRLDGAHYGELHDYWGGLNDLRLGLVRVLHSLSFVDDPTRMLRAVRFEQRFGFCIEDRTLQLMENALSLLDRVSGDRIRHELDHMLDEPQVAAMFARLHELGLLRAIHPALTWDAWLSTRIPQRVSAPPPSEWNVQVDSLRVPLHRALGYVLWLMRLPSHALQGAIRRLKFSRLLADCIRGAQSLWVQRNVMSEMRPSEITRLLDAVRPLSRYAFFLALEANDPLRARLETYVWRWQHLRPQTTGDDLRARGLAPGPRYARILEALRAAWLDGEVTSAVEEEALLERLLREET